MGGEELFLIVSLLILLISASIYYFDSTVNQEVGRWIASLKELASEKGILGAFIITLLSNSSLFITVPYTSVIFFLGSAGVSPIILGISSGIGAVIGETISFFIGWGGSLLLAKKHEARFERINRLLKSRPRLTPVLIYIFGATPLPDDILLVPLGFIRYPFFKIILPLTLGKITNVMSIAFLGRYSSSLFHNLFGQEEFSAAGFLTLFLTILIIYFTLKINWDKILSRTPQ